MIANKIQWYQGNRPVSAYVARAKKRRAGSRSCKYSKPTMVNVINETWPSFALSRNIVNGRKGEKRGVIKRRDYEAYGAQPRQQLTLFNRLQQSMRRNDGPAEMMDPLRRHAP